MNFVLFVVESNFYLPTYVRKHMVFKFKGLPVIVCTYIAPYHTAYQETSFIIIEYGTVPVLKYSWYINIPVLYSTVALFVIS